MSAIEWKLPSSPTGADASRHPSAEPRESIVLRTHLPPEGVTTWYTVTPHEGHEIISLQQVRLNTWQVTKSNEHESPRRRVAS
jgi:hypothetical protein